MLTRLRMAMERFMTGRNGMDLMGMHAWWAGLIVMILNMFMGSLALEALSMALLIYAVWRSLSRNTVKRQAENLAYTRWQEKVSKEVKQFFLRLKGMKTYKYFRCPGCKNRLRMKRGSGQKHITCPVCRHEFDQKA